MSRTRSILLALALAIAALSSRASACILEFRSTDSQVAQSPLVVIATVTKVTPEPLTPELAQVFSDGLIKPTTATVAIQQILKGATDLKTLRVSSGPIRSCNLYPVHLDFTPSKSYIFILTPKSDADSSAYQLAWAGSLQETSVLPSVQDSIARCTTWRADYLARVEKNSPDTFHAAETLDQKLTALSKQWPTRSEDSLTPAELLHGISDDPATQTATNTALALLNAATPAAVQTALALDFNRTPADQGNWSRHPLWSQIRLRYTDAHAPEILALNESEWSRLLPAHSTTPDQFNKYLTRVTVESPTLAFPIPAPDSIPNLRGDSLTTDFLIRSQSFDRGDLYFNYGMQPDTLSTINTDRVSPLLSALYENQNDHLKWAAATAFAEMPTDHFLSLLLPHLVAGDPMPITDLQPDTLAEKHLLALLDYANTHASPQDQAKIWNRLNAAQCFTPTILARASAATPTPEITAFLKAASSYQKSSQSLFN